MIGQLEGGSSKADFMSFRWEEGGSAKPSKLAMGTNRKSM